ncbi:MAG TPA: response regulator transcription factor [Pseudonocardiaceae bacterium]|nr:response regulator transcription factor [Pseudonocardiaceae bacterium]
MRQAEGPAAIRVVLADDEELVRHGLRSVLEASDDIRVVATAADGIELVRLVSSTPCDVVLVDVRMPRADGLTAVRQLGELAGGSGRPVSAVLTTFDFDDYVYGALDGGAMGFLLKDASPDFLRAAVRDLAAGGAVIDPRITARLLPRLRDSAAGAVAERALEALSQRERQVLQLIGDGSSNAEIADRLKIAESTVKGYVSAVLAKLGAANRVQAAVLARRLPPDSGSSS